jgi:hypothetical protein
MVFIFLSFVLFSVNTYCKECIEDFQLHYQ